MMEDASSLYSVHEKVWITQWIHKVSKVTISTDVSRGYSPSILDAMRLALHTSKAVHFKNNLDKGYIPLSLHEALYLATLGGAQGE